MDQIDTILARSYMPDDGGGVRNKAIHTVNLVGDGLLSLRELTRRTVSVVSCLPSSWAMIESEAVKTVPDRFRRMSPLKVIDDPATARQIVARRLAVGYGRVGFTPDYDTWPIRPEAFSGHLNMTPRQVLQTVDKHVRTCLHSNQITELMRLTATRARP